MRRALAAVALLLPAAPLLAQGPGGFALPVGFAEAIEHSVQRSVELTGSVESRSQSRVAAEVPGMVVALEAREGEAVRRGQPLVKLRRQTAELRLEAAEGQLQEARALLKLAETNRARAEQLFAEQVYSQQQLDDALSQFDANQGRVSRLEAEVAQLRDDLERTVVRAPYDGVVVEEHTAVGEWLGAGDPVVDLVDSRDLEVTLEVPEQFFAGLTPGEQVPVVVTALGGDVFTGSVRAVVPRADPKARTFPLKVGLPNPDGRIGIGMLARVAVPVGEPRSAVVVPKDALVTRGDSSFVFLLSESNEARLVPVVAGSAASNWVAVQGEVNAGDRVVVQGNERLQPGQPVQPQRLEIERP